MFKKIFNKRFRQSFKFQYYKQNILQHKKFKTLVLLKAIICWFLNFVLNFKLHLDYRVKIIRIKYLSISRSVFLDLASYFCYSN